MRLPPPAHNQTSAQLLPYQKFCIQGTDLRTIRIKPLFSCKIENFKTITSNENLTYMEY